jgi:hypothetical protein
MTDGTVFRFKSIDYPNSRTQGISIETPESETIVPLWRFQSIEFLEPTGGKALLVDQKGQERIIDRYVVGKAGFPGGILFVEDDHPEINECSQRFWTAHDQIRKIEFDANFFGWLAINPESGREYPAIYQFDPLTGAKLELQLVSDKPLWWPIPHLGQLFN